MYTLVMQVMLLLSANQGDMSLSASINGTDYTGYVEQGTLTIEVPGFPDQTSCQQFVQTAPQPFGDIRYTVSKYTCVASQQ
jgi:hypothetical protein